MDKCVRIAVVLVLSSHIASGWTYAPRVDSHEHFHHSFESHQPNEWPDKDPDWDHYKPGPSHQRPAHYQRENKETYPHKHTHGDKEFWKSHHSGEWDSGSWEYPDFSSQVGHHSWGNHGWGHHEMPNHRPHQPSGPPRPNKPNWNNEKPSSWGPIAPPSTPPTSTSKRSSGSSSQDSLAIRLCIKSCPVTSEYNPVCGSDNVTYNNPGRLECAKYCGVEVTLQRNSVCPAATLNDVAENQPGSRPVTLDVQQTLKPIEPTWSSPVEVPATQGTESTSRPPPAASNPPFTISPDVLNSIFTSSTTPEDDNWDIDIRTRSRLPSQQVFPV